MDRFIAKHTDRITGVLSGFDRLVFRGTLRQIAYPAGLMGLLWKHQVLLKKFGPYADGLTSRLKEASLKAAGEQGRPVRYLASSQTNKEAVALKIAQSDGIKQGLIAVLSCVEPCMSYEIFRNPDTKHLELVSRLRKGLCLYHYFIDPIFGFMNARIQTWLPFGIQVCLNGREWLARQMDKAGIRYRRRDNCFPWVSDVQRAQGLLDRQLNSAWPSTLHRIARMLNPAHAKILAGFPIDYYWSTYQSEWATDIMFRDSAALAEIYPALLQHGITAFSSPDVMRFLGRKVTGAFQGEIVSDFKDRPEGVRIKHRVGLNSVKLYDKQGCVLRAETTINDPHDFKVFRPLEGGGQPAWRVMRRGIADLYRRAQVSQASNERYLDALATVDTSTPLGTLVAEICRPTDWRGKRVRALQPWAKEDMRLFRAVTRGEFNINGFRNRDLQALLYDQPAESAQEQRHRSARVTRLLRMLRAHGLITKVTHTHRYILTVKGRQTLPAILTVDRVPLARLEPAAS